MEIVVPTRPQERVRMGHPLGREGVEIVIPPVRKSAYGWGTRFVAAASGRRRAERLRKGYGG